VEEQEAEVIVASSPRRPLEVVEEVVVGMQVLLQKIAPATRLTVSGLLASATYFRLLVQTVVEVEEVEEEGVEDLMVLHYSLPQKVMLVVDEEIREPGVGSQVVEVEVEVEERPS